MASSGKHIYDDELLTRYVLGELPVEQAEQFDELSIVDEEFAWRLAAVEDDLVDAFVRGELAGEKLNKFQNSYLASPRRREKVAFATALRERGKQSAGPAPAADEPATSRRRWSIFQGPRPLFQWAVAGVAAVAALAAIFFFTDNMRLRQQVAEARAIQSSGPSHEQQLEQQLKEQRAASAAAQQELDRLRQAGPDLSQVTTVALMLAPPTRGLEEKTANVTVHPGTDLVALLLDLESDDFPLYRISVKDPATRQELWHSSEVAAASAAGHRAVTVSVPAKVLKQQRYLVQLTGLPKTGAETPVADYMFAVVMK